MNVENTGAWDLRLYIAGKTPRALRALKNLQRLCDEHLAGLYSIEVIDLEEQPQLAAGDQIVAVPTLVRRLPEPVRKIIGDLKKLLAGSTLGLEPGVDFVQIGTHTQKVQSLSEAEFTDVLRIRVLASVQIPDEPGEDYEPPPAGALYLQRQFAERDADGTVTLTPIGDADPIPR